MSLYPPQLITGARMVYIVWLPADPTAAGALVPDGLTPQQGAPVYLNQYVVDDAAQTSNAASPDGFGAYSLTYLGIDLAGLDTEAGVPGRWWTHYFDSSPNMISYALDHGVPAEGGETTLELSGESWWLRRSSPVIRSSGPRRASRSGRPHTRRASCATSRGSTASY